MVAETLPGPQTGLCTCREPGLGFGSEKVPCSCGFTVVSCPDLKGLNRVVLNSSFFAHLWFLPRIWGPSFVSDSWGSKVISEVQWQSLFPWTRPTASLLIMLHGDDPHSLTLRGTLRKSFFLSVSGSLCLKFAQS